MYLKEVAATKEFYASINYQLISAVSFPGLEDLPKKVTQWIQDSRNSPTATPRQEVRRTLLADSLASTNGSTASVTSTQTAPTATQGSSSEGKRPPLFSSKSNSSFLKLSLKRDLGLQQQQLLLAKPKTLSNPTSPSLRPVSHKRDNLSISSFTSVSSLSDLPGSEKSKLADPLSNVDLESFASYCSSGSIFTNLPTVLLKYHLNAYGANIKSHRDLTMKMIPKLESLFKTMSLKIKELKSYVKNDAFANTEVLKEISKTGKILAEFTSAVERYNGSAPVVKGKYSAAMASLTSKMKSSELKSGDQENDENSEETASTVTEEEEGVSDDPFLVKLRLDHQLKYQLLQENYKFASYVNLQNIARDIFSYMYKELSMLLMRMGKLSSNEYAFGDDPVGGLYLMLKEKLLSTSSEDFEHFAIHNDAFINIYKDSGANFRKENRVFSNLKIPYHDSIHSKCLRFGPLYKKSKIMKNYSCHYFLLTCNYLHEFKLDMTPSNDSSNGNKSGAPTQKKTKVKTFIGPDDIPVKSYNLNEYSIKPRSDDAKGFKFVLCKRSNMSRKSTFKCLDEHEFDGWYNDLFELLKFGSKHLERFGLVQEKLEARDLDLSSQTKKKNYANLRLDLSNQPINVPITPNLSPTNSHTGLKQVGDDIVSSSLTIGNQNEALSGIFTPRVVSPKLTQEFPFNQNANFSIENNHTLFSSGSSQLVTPAVTPPFSEAYRSIDEEEIIRLQELQLLREKINELQRQRMQAEDSQSKSVFSAASLHPDQLKIQGSMGNGHESISGYMGLSEFSPHNSRPSTPELFVNGNINIMDHQKGVYYNTLSSTDSGIQSNMSPRSETSNNGINQGTGHPGHMVKVLVSDH